MTREDILEAAAQVFRQKGFHGASMSDIARSFVKRIVRNQAACYIGMRGAPTQPQNQNKRNQTSRFLTHLTSSFKSKRCSCHLTLNRTLPEAYCSENVTNWRILILSFNTSMVCWVKARRADPNNPCAPPSFLASLLHDRSGPKHASSMSGSHVRLDPLCQYYIVAISLPGIKAELHFMLNFRRFHQLYQRQFASFNRHFAPILLSELFGALNILC